jgi:hypothetical protein
MKMKLLNLSLVALATFSISACTHGNVSEVPQMINGEAVFTYQGRSNFGHQLEAADKFMVNHCNKFNGGSPVALGRSTQDLGYVVTKDYAAGNQNQLVLFKCVK